MIEIDGSHGEGGGQIVRTAVALSAATSRAVCIKAIRRGRPRPGLAPQHVSAIKALSSICGARTTGVHIGSQEIEFFPGPVRKGSYNIDIGTAGSITLLVQCLLPALTVADGPVTATIRGGTDVLWSPTIDYMERVALRAISLYGVCAALSHSVRGYYPKGGGLAVLHVKPSALHPHSIDESGSIQSNAVYGISHACNLKADVAQRQASAAKDTLIACGIDAEIEIEIEETEGPSIGSGITLWSGYRGSSSLGARGVRAEEVGRKAAMDLIREIMGKGSVDVHLADQLIPYLAFVGGQYSTNEITNHTMTNIWTAGHFLDRMVKITRSGPYVVKA